MNTVKEAIYTKDLHILITPELDEFLESLNGGKGHHIRKMIVAYQGKFSKDLADIETRLAELEPEYLALKKRREEILQEKTRQEAENRSKDKRVDEAHKKLLELLKNHHNRMDLMPAKSFKLYSDFCEGDPSPETLKAWLEGEAKRQGIIK